MYDDNKKIKDKSIRLNSINLKFNTTLWLFTEIYDSNEFSTNNRYSYKVII